MNTRYFFIALNCMLALFITPVFANELNKSFCHLHPPGSEPTEDVSQLQKFNSARDCFQENRQRYSGQGRCHCSFSRFPSKRLPFNRGNREQNDSRGDSPVQ